MSGRVDGPAKAWGAARFCADALPGGHLHGAVLTTTLPHARVEVDIALLGSLPGVVAALGPADDPGRPFTQNPHGATADCSVFTGVGRFAGDVVGAVAATTRAALAAALAHPGVVREEPLPAVTSLDEALAAEVCANPRYPGNVIARVELGAGRDELRSALGASPLRHRSSVVLEPAPHGFLERVAAGARFDGGRCSVWSTTQCPWLVRRALAALLGLDERDVDMEPVYVGGGFGGKEELFLEPVAALLSRASGGLPVLVELSREQCTRRHRTRHGGRIEVETGFDADGRFLARALHVVFEAGPYDGHSANVVRNALASGLRLYPGGVVGGDGIAVATNRVQGGAYRGYGSTQASFAVETHVDAIAARLGVDPVELRRRNAARPSDLDPAGVAPMAEVRALDCLAELASRLGRSSVKATAGVAGDPAMPSTRRGRGVALLVCTSAAVSDGEEDSAEIGCRFEPDRGVVVVETGTAEAGQGVHEAIAAAVRHALGAGCPVVEVLPTRSGNARADAGMFGSRGANVTCSAAMRAAESLRATVLAVAARRLGAAADEVVLDAGWRAASIAETAWASTVAIPTDRLGPIEVAGRYATDDPGLAYGAQGVDVVVDLRTGAVRVERVVSVHDVGTLLAPEVARAQVEGGVVQAVGGALYEHLTFDDGGVPVESGFLGQLMPTLVDLPAIEVAFVERPLRGPEEAGEAPPGGEPAGAELSGGSRRSSGAKGLGEAPVMGVAAAIANAVRDALGVEVARLPLRPEAVLSAWTSRRT